MTRTVVIWCDCVCHKSPDLDWNPLGVDTRDPIAAESACSQCKAKHCRTLLDDPPSVPLPRGDTYTAWVDPSYKDEPEAGK